MAPMGCYKDNTRKKLRKKLMTYVEKLIEAEQAALTTGVRKAEALASDREGMIVRCNGKYTDFRLYDQHRPTKLEDVPDRWVIQASWTFNGKPETFLIFKVDGTWLDLKGEAGFKSYNNPLSWQLTDCIVEFETVEVEVIG